MDFLERNNLKLEPLKHFIRENGFVQLIKTPTRLNRNGGSCLDWIITDSAYVKDYGVLGDLLSDHFQIFCVRKKKREHMTREWKTIRMYKNYDKEAFVNLLCQSDWIDYDVEENPKVLWDIISSKIENILSVMCPYKKVFIKSRKTPWITPEIIHYMKERSKCARILKKTNGYGLFEICKYLRNKVNTLVRNAKSSYIQNTMNINIKNPNIFWRTINSLLPPKKPDVSDINFIDPVSNLEIPSSEASNFLNRYFINIGSTQGNDPVQREQTDV